MTLMEQLIAKLGLPPGATEADILAAIPAVEDAACAEAAQASLTEIATIIGLPGAAAPALIDAIRAKTSALPAEVTALQAELAQVTTDLKAFKKAQSVAFVDDAIKAGRVGVKPSRDRFIAMHMSDPTGTEAIIAGLPTLGVTHTNDLPPKTEGEVTSLNAEELAVAKATGRSPADFAAMMAADRKEKEARL